MTTNQTIDGVPGLRSLIERVTSQDLGMSAKKDRAEAAHELRALLDAPVPFPGYPPVPEDRKLPAAQPQGEPVAILSGPDDSVCWTQDGKPKELRKQVVLIEHADLLRLQELAYGAAGMVYQTRWNRLGDWEEWKTVSLEQYQRSEGRLFERRIVYAEQPAPVAVVMPGRADASNGSHDHQSGWNACLDELKRLNTARPAHATPPLGAEPCGTHHDNDGLDEMRKP